MTARVFLCFFLGLIPLLGAAEQSLSCKLEHNGEEAVLAVLAEADALGGRWQDIGLFKFRAVLAAPAHKVPWLLVEVYAKSENGDYRIVTAQKVSKPYDTGKMDVVEPRLGRILRYQCGTQP